MLMRTLLSLCGIVPSRIGSGEAFFRQLSVQLARHGWQSVLCFESMPTGAVRHYLSLPNVSFESLRSPERLRLQTLKNFVALLRRHQPEILHLHCVGFLSLYPRLAQLCGVKRVYFTDHTSRPALHVPRRAAPWKRAITRLVNRPLAGVVCVSGYGHTCMSALDVLPAARLHVIYNGVDTTRAREDPDTARE